MAATPTTINGSQIRTASVPQSAIDAAFQTYLSGMSTNISNIFTTLSTDEATVAAINAATQAWEAADTSITTAIQSLITGTLTGAGLTKDGVYVAPTNSNYLGAATSLMTADIALDTALAAEAARATTAETGLQGQITAIVNSTSSANALASEVTRATAAEAA